MIRTRYSAVLLVLALSLSGVSLVNAQNARVESSSRHHRSGKTLSDIARDARAPIPGRPPFAIANKFHIEKTRATEGEAVVDPIVQSFAGSLAPAVTANFDGSSDDDNAAVVGFRVVPPDTEGDVGPNHYVQWINVVSEIFDKNGNSILGPFAGNAYFDGLGGDCDSDNDGDPIVLYDEMADRWLVSQFSVAASPYSMCVAISQTADPTGAYYQYEFSFGTDFPDYPKLGVWGDSYTMTTRDFTSGIFFGGISAVALDRNAMLSGQPATMVRFENAFGGTFVDGYLPADADGAVSGPAVFGGHGDDGDTTFELWELDVDWSNPGAATFTSIPGVTVNPFDGIVPSADQPNGQGLDDLSFFTMHRLNVRDFGSHMSMVANHTVEASPGTAGVRWYEFRNTGANWTLHQEGTFSPDDDDRWMGSIAINAAGDIALGYSRSSGTLFPSIFFTGQTADQSGTGVMNVAETEIHLGSGSQSGASRWGDYSMMSVDPSTDAFWYTTEYYASTASFDFNTRIASFVLEDNPGAPIAGFTYSCSLLTCDFADQSVDGDGSIVAWNWDLGDGTFSTDQNPSHSFPATGSYLVTLTVTDNDGNSDGTSQTVSVDDGAGGGTMHVASMSAPVLVRSGSTGTAQVTVTIKDDADLPVADATVFGIFSGDVAGEPSGVTDANGEVVLISDPVFARPFDIVLCVSAVTHASFTYDPSQNPDPTFACEPSGPTPPAASFTHSASGLTVDFTDTSTDDGTIVSWLWDFGDSGTSGLQNPTHIYAADGTYPVSLTVTDNDGNADSDSESITVTEGTGGTMHVEAISDEVLIRSAGLATAEVTVTIEDNLGIPIASATVSGVFSGDGVTGTPSGVTNANGEVVLVSDSFARRPSFVDLCVSDVTHASLTYDPNDNADPSFDCGTAGPAAKRQRTLADLSTTQFDFELTQNFPNPFYETSLIRYQLAESVPVRLNVYNTIGQVVATLVNTHQSSGMHTVAFNAGSLSAGVYLYVLEAGNYRATRRMTLLR